MYGWKKGLSAPVLILAVCLVFTACSGRNEGGPANSQGGERQAGETRQEEQTPTEEKQDPVELKVYVSDINKPISPGESMSIPTIKYMAEKTNTVLDVTFLPHGQYNEQLRLKFASGEFPDFYMSGGIGNDETVLNGLALPLNDLIDEYGPNLKKLVPQSAWDAVTLNGQILAIPQFTGGGTDSNGLIYIRKDYLDKIGGKVPQTSDEFLEMLRLFRDMDPDGNGMQDTIPFSAREKISWMDNIFGMWGVNPASNILYNNQLIPGFAHPNMKLGLAFVRQMYEEKLIDSEFMMNTGTIWKQKITSGQVASYNHTVNQVMEFQVPTQEANPAADVNIIAIPTPRGTGYDGPVGKTKYPLVLSRIVLNTTKHPEAIIELFDWLSTEEGQIYTDLGLEGDTYERDGDRYVYDSKKDENLFLMRNVFAVQPLYFNEQTIEARYDAESIDRINFSYDIAREEGLANPTVAMPTPKTLLENSELGWSGSLVLEGVTKIILGEAPLESYDQIIDSWRKQGGDRLIGEMTEWYNNNK